MDVPTHEDTVSSFTGHGADMSSEQQDHPHADLQHSQTDILPESRLRSESTDSAGQRRLRSSSTSTTKSNDGSPHGLSKLLHSSKRRRRRQREVEEAAQQFPIPQLKVTSLKDDPVAESDTEVADQDLESKSTVASSSALASAPSSENVARPGSSSKETTSTSLPRPRGNSSTTTSSTRGKLKDIFSASSRDRSPSSPNRNRSGSTRFKKSKTGLSSTTDVSDNRSRTESDPVLHDSLHPINTNLGSPQEIVHSPETTVTPPTPDGDRQRRPQRLPTANIADAIDSAPAPPPQDQKPPRTSPPNVIVSPSGNMISHRRVRSAAPSVTTPVPNKPGISKAPTTSSTPEEPKARNATQGLASGFLTSVFSAAQNAMGLNTKASSEPNEAERATPAQSTSPQEDESETSAQETERKERAVDTLGEGELNFSDLGIDATSGGVITTRDGIVFTQTDTAGRPRKPTASQRDELVAKIEELRSARAVSMAYEKQDDGQGPSSPNDITQNEFRPSGSYLASTNRVDRSDSTGSHTPPATASVAGSNGLASKKSNSVRGKIRRRRHRGSSGSTIGALGAAGLGLSGAGGAGVQRLTGFAVASKKRNKEFHALFRSVPEDDYLIEDYSCALQREIILAGRIYISEGHICFSSNILGWVTTLVISFDEIIAIEKETTAMVFPNAIAIQTLHARHTFRSLLSREATYDLMVNIWRINHPTSLRSSVNGTRIDNGTGDKTEKLEGDEAASISGTEGSDDEEIYDEDEDDMAYPENGSVVASEPSSLKRHGSGSTSNGANGEASAPSAGKSDKTSKAGEAAGGLAAQDFPGPKTHEPTEYTDPSGAFEKMLKDEVVQAPLGQVYSLLFGPASAAFISKFLLEGQKVFDLQMGEDNKGLGAEQKQRSYSYVRPLNASIGPKQTKCITKESLEFFDLEKAVCVILTTQTPDVPSGNVFAVKTKYIMTWGPNNSTRMHVSCMVEWSGKSWFKGPIEKGSNDGQMAYSDDLMKALKGALTSRSRSATATSKTAKAGKSKRKRETSDESETPAVNAQETKEAEPTWGKFEPLRAPLSALGGGLKTLLQGNVSLVVIIFLVTMLMFRSSSQPARDVHPLHLSLNDRIAIYEDLWLRQEAELWDWLEDRVGMRGNSYPVLETERRDAESQRLQRQREKAEKTVNSQISKERMNRRELEDAIRLTQRRLDILQGAVSRDAPGGEGETSE